MDDYVNISVDLHAFIYVIYINIYLVFSLIIMTGIKVNKVLTHSSNPNIIDSIIPTITGRTLEGRLISSPLVVCMRIPRKCRTMFQGIFLYDLKLYST